MEPKTKTFEPLKIRLSEGLDARLRSHAEKTGATLNSIICLAIDAFIPGGVIQKQVLVPVPAPIEPEKAIAAIVLTPKRPSPMPPKLGANPTKAQRNKVAKWRKKYGGIQGDLLSGD
jgi:hypothetical protein